MNEKIKNVIVSILAVIGVLVAIFGLLAIFAGQFIFGLISILIGTSLCIPSLKQSQLSKANDELKKLEDEKNKIYMEIVQLREDKENEIKAKKLELDNLLERINSYDEELTVKYVDTRDYSDISSEQIKNELAMLAIKSKDLIKDGGATNHNITAKNQE